MTLPKKQTLNKSNLDNLLFQVAKRYKKKNRNSPNATITLVGGAAILAQFDFRDMTTDIDAIIRASSSLKEAINEIGDENDLPQGWLNDDFKYTQSFSKNIDKVSIFYKNFCHILDVRVVPDIYLIAMKLKSGREYKKDQSDAIGIISSMKKQGKEVNVETIEKAIYELYGDNTNIPIGGRKVLEILRKNEINSDTYDLIKNQEMYVRENLIAIEKEDPNNVSNDNLDDVIYSILKAKK